MTHKEIFEYTVTNLLRYYYNDPELIFSVYTDEIQWDLCKYYIDKELISPQNKRFSIAIYLFSDGISCNVVYEHDIINNIYHHHKNNRHYQLEYPKKEELDHMINNIISKHPTLKQYRDEKINDILNTF